MVWCLSETFCPRNMRSLLLWVVKGKLWCDHFLVSLERRNRLHQSVIVGSTFFRLFLFSIDFTLGSLICQVRVTSKLGNRPTSEHSRRLSIVLPQPSPSPSPACALSAFAPPFWGYRTDMKTCDMRHATYIYSNTHINRYRRRTCFFRVGNLFPNICINHVYFNIHVGKDGVCDIVCTLPPQRR
jgi:hypothetical protein